MKQTRSCWELDYTGCKEAKIQSWKSHSSQSIPGHICAMEIIESWSMRGTTKQNLVLKIPTITPAVMLTASKLASRSALRGGFKPAIQQSIQPAINGTYLFNNILWSCHCVPLQTIWFNSNWHAAIENS